MKDIVIIGTENIGKEVVKIIEAINSKKKYLECVRIYKS